MAKIEILLNGKKETVNHHTILELLNHFKLSVHEIIVELNGTIIERNNYENQSISNNDCIEIIRYIGGGNN